MHSQMTWDSSCVQLRPHRLSFLIASHIFKIAHQSLMENAKQSSKITLSGQLKRLMKSQFFIFYFYFFVIIKSISPKRFCGVRLAWAFWKAFKLYCIQNYTWRKCLCSVYVALHGPFLFRLSRVGQNSAIHVLCVDFEILPLLSLITSPRIIGKLVSPLFATAAHFLGSWFFIFYFFGWTTNFGVDLLRLC